MRKKDGLLVCLKIAGKDKSALVEAEFKILKPLAGRLAFITLPWKLGMATFWRFLMLPSFFSLLAAPSPAGASQVDQTPTYRPGLRLLRDRSKLDPGTSPWLLDAFGMLLASFK